MIQEGTVASFQKRITGIVVDGFLCRKTANGAIMINYRKYVG
jgi:hypothetical protein